MGTKMIAREREKKKDRRSRGSTGGGEKEDSLFRKGVSSDGGGYEGRPSRRKRRECGLRLKRTSLQGKPDLRERLRQRSGFGRRRSPTFRRGGRDIRLNERERKAPLWKRKSFP